MKRNLYLGLTISICNLLFYAITLDLLFHAGLFLRFFGFDLEQASGTVSTLLGVVSLMIAITLEVTSYKVIRRGVSVDHGKNEEVS